MQTSKQARRKPTITVSSKQLQMRLRRVARNLDLCVGYVLEKALIEGGLETLEDVETVTVLFPKDVLDLIKEQHPNRNDFIVDAVFQSLGLDADSCVEKLQQRALINLFSQTLRVNRLCA